MEVKYVEELLSACAPNAGGQSPLGWCYRPVTEAAKLAELVNYGFFRIGAASEHGIPVQPTETVMKWKADADAQQHHAPQAAAPAIRPAQPAAVMHFDDNIPPPAPKASGFARPEGGTLIERLGFDKLLVNQSFFVGPEYSPKADVPVHRAMASTVSNAKKQLFPKNFVIAQVDETEHGRGPGARIWRVADIEGPRPEPRKRAPRTPAPAAPQMAPQPPQMAPAFQPPAFAPFDPSGPSAPAHGAPPAFGGPPPFQAG